MAMIGYWKHEHVHANSLEEFIQQVNNLGDDGYELVGFAIQNNCYIGILKKYDERLRD